MIKLSLALSAKAAMASVAGRPRIYDEKTSSSEWSSAGRTEWTRTGPLSIFVGGTRLNDSRHCGGWTDADEDGAARHGLEQPWPLRTGYYNSTYFQCMLPPDTANKLWIFGSLSSNPYKRCGWGTHNRDRSLFSACITCTLLSFFSLSFSADISAAGGRARPSQFPLGARAQRGRERGKEQKGN